MATRCSIASPVFLPFLYPSLFARSTRCISRTRIQSSSQVRYHITESNSVVNPNSTSSGTAPNSRLNPAPDDFASTSFADKANITIHAGPGGNGCISFLREAYFEDGPANGGDGGHGGNIYIQAVHGETSLHKLSRRHILRAGKGKSGMGSARSGQRGDDVVITVPVGTIVRELSRHDPAAEEMVLRRAYRRKQLAIEAAKVVEEPAPEEEEEIEERPARRRRRERREREELAAQEEDEDPGRHNWLLYPGISSSDARNMELPRLPRRERFFTQPAAPIHLDLSRPTPRPILLAAGGLGGLGNPHFASKERPRPMIATKGEQAMTMDLEMELKLLADVGLVGLPNAGKSTLLRAISNSRTRVGAWQFTTLQPNIGTVVLDNSRGRPFLNTLSRRAVPDADDTEVAPRTRFTVADIPGLIEGAHLDKGLGIAFLRHVERAGVLAFVIDLSAGNAVKALHALWNEVGLYAQMREEEDNIRERAEKVDWGALGNGGGMLNAGDITIADYPQPPERTSGLHIASKPWFVVATKGDLPETQENFKELREHLTQISNGDVPHPSGIEGAWTKNVTAIPVSAINGQGVDRVVHWTVGLLDE